MKFKEEEIILLKKYTLEFINQNQLTLKKSYMSNDFFLRKKEKNVNVTDYELEYFINNNISFQNKEEKLLLSYIDQKNFQLGTVLLKKSLKIPNDFYEKTLYIHELIDIYTHNLKYKKNLKQILFLKPILNKYPDIILEYLKKQIFLEDEKKIFLEYYRENFIKNKLFENNLEYKRIVHLMNKTLKKPLDFSFFEENEELNYELKEGKGIYIQIKTEDVMKKYYFIEEKYIINTINSLEELKNIEEFMVDEIILQNKENKNFIFLFLSNYGKNFFQQFIDLYFKSMLLSEDKTMMSYEELRNNMKEIFITVQKKLLEESIEKKNNIIKIKKI